MFNIITLANIKHYNINELGKDKQNRTNKQLIYEASIHNI